MNMDNREVQVAKGHNVNPLHEWMGRCEHDRLHKSLPHIAGVLQDCGLQYEWEFVQGLCLRKFRKLKQQTESKQSIWNV